jgi:hypothetical protein
MLNRRSWTRSESVGTSPARGGACDGIAAVPAPALAARRGHRFALRRTRQSAATELRDYAMQYRLVSLLAGNEDWAIDKAGSARLVYGCSRADNSRADDSLLGAWA